MRIPLTISEDYCASWGLFEGVREFMQNARDATRAGCTFDAFYAPEKALLTVRTKGAILEHRTLLLGQSTKRGRADMLGEQGEGYKIGSLVLCRLGKGIKIRTGGEVWQPDISFSKKFGANVLTFDILGGRKERSEIVVEISGISPEEWAPVAPKFLFLEEHSHEVVVCPTGAVLMDGGGDLFVDGIWVCKNEELVHGYDFLPSDVDLDRDRRMVSGFDAKTLSAKAWETLYMRTTQEYCSMVDGMLADNTPDIQHFRYDWCVGQGARKKVADRFKEKFGGDAVAVSSESEVRELEFYGREGQVVMSEPLREVLERECGTVASVRVSLADKVKKEYSMIDIDPEESQNLLASIQFVSHALDRKFGKIHNDITIVDFMDPRIQGMRKQGKIYLSRNCLASFEEALKTVVEEVAHEVGADGTHHHVEMIHEIYAAGIAGILKGKNE